jgi:GAF domain-containing protein
MSESRLGAAVAAGVLGADAAHAELLQSIVDNARTIFAARAASIMFYEAETHELVFAAVSGEGQGRIVGERLPAGTGIAGWVLTSAESMIVEDVTRDPRFARAVAERTGYVPKTLMAAPLIHGEETIGVLNVLDRSQQRFSVAEMDLLAKFAAHAAIALSVVRASLRAKRVLEADAGDEVLVARLAATLDVLEGPRREAGMRLLEALEALLRA